MKEYDHKAIEEKWQKQWRDTGLYKTEEDPRKPKSYVLDMFPYPSGEGLHVGHPKGYIATDIYSRYKHMQGYNILHPMGWDAFGLPAEQYALKNKVHPRDAVAKNTERFKEQLAKIGFNYDWDREINTTDPKFYKWTQWIWKQIWKSGLAYESNEPINWCPSCKTGLSNEDLDGDVCERCGTKVEQKPLRQWVLAITKYADRMLLDLDKLNWPESIKDSQRNWIGKSNGAEIEFSLFGITGKDDGKHKVKVFTTRADTLFGATFIAISAELALKWMSLGWNPGIEVKTFARTTLEEEKVRAADYSEITEKKGIATGIFAENPANKERIPVWIANYVLSGYGTGAIMAVPAHDERDGDFAKKYGLPIRVVIEPETGEKRPDEQFRSSIVAIVEDPSSGKYLTLNWGQKLGGTLFVGGGRESSEDPEATARREIIEETGFTDLALVSMTERMHHHYFAFSKNVARNTDVIGLYFKLTGKTQNETTHQDDEKGNFVLEWLSSNEILQKMADENHRLCFRRLVLGEMYTSEGILTNSGTFNNFTSEGARRAITEAVGGKLVSTYKLKDWVFARQRYWGEPFPIVFDEARTPYVVADSELPVLLPEVEAYEPTGTGESPLAGISEWVNVYGYINTGGEFETLPQNDARAKKFTRETNTMPQWAGSSWYYLRYIDPSNETALVAKDKDKVWSPVDFYVGGAEHATRHLIYARFWHKFLYDIGVVNYDEPFTRLMNVGLIQAVDGRKMSKRYGNVINPDDIVETFGADSLRIYEMFMGPFDQSIAWSSDNMMGARRMIERVWKLSNNIMEASVNLSETDVFIHQTIKKVGDDIESFSFNTAIAQLMIFLNHLERLPKVPRSAYEIFLKLLAPFAPHVTEELWVALGNTSSLYRETWPMYDEAKTITAVMTIAVQINGKLRDTMEVARGTGEEEVKQLALERSNVMKWLGGKTPSKIIYVEEKIVSIVVSDA